MENNYAFIDFQGFKDNLNRFIIKEFALITKNLKFHDVIKSPAIILDEKHERQAKWLMENYHGLKWCCGNISLSELRNAIQPILINKTVYLKGEEKVKWLKYILVFSKKNNTINTKLNIINLETINCPISLHKKNTSNQNEYHTCKNHQTIKNKLNPICHCAMMNVSILNDWYTEEQKKKKKNICI